MDNEYKRIVDEVKCEENKLVNGFLAFSVGGLIGLISELIFKYLTDIELLSDTVSYTIIFIFWIMLASILTGMIRSQVYLNQV